MRISRKLKVSLFIVAFVGLAGFGATTTPGIDFIYGLWARWALSTPFIGVTTNGTVTPGLFTINASGVSTEGVQTGVEGFLASLSPEQRAAATFGVDDEEWRLWNNIHIAPRQGVSFREMNDHQRQLAHDFLKASLSVKGYETSRDIMRLNGHAAELLSNFEAYGDDLYWITIMGEPSPTMPWGWQLDGHHLIINYFVLGDQVVMTPSFMGSEPVAANSGKYAGTVVLQAEQAAGLKFVNSLSEAQKKIAIIGTDKNNNHNQAEFFKDNLILDYEGLRASEFDDAHRAMLLALIETHVSNMDAGHAQIKMAEVTAHLNDTYFAWIGDTEPDSVFYYRIQSPVILIEFDHQSPVALDRPNEPSREHIHTVVRTPNGNDYGKDLLRQHYLTHKNDPGHGH